MLKKWFFLKKKCKKSSAPTRNLIVSVPMFWSTGNHWGLQEDTHYCPNVTCWCVNCQLICMQKLHQFPVCFIYEESLQIDMSTGPNAVDVSTVSSFVCRRSTFALYCSQFDRKTHTIVPIQHVDVSTVSLSVCRRCTFEMLPLCFIYEESIPIRGVQNINMSKFCLADYLNPFSLLSCSQKYQNFLFRIMGSASSGIGYFGKNSLFWSKI